MSANNWLLEHKSNKLSLDLKSIGHISKIHLLKVSFDLLLTERLGQRVCHIQRRVDSLYLEELLKVFVHNVKPPLYVLRLLVRPELFSESYGVVVVTLQCNGI